MTDTPENAGPMQGRDPKGRWRKGSSGNAAGKTRGTRHRATLAAESLLDGEADKLTRKAVELALNGDAAALKLCLERLLPPRRDRAVSVALPELDTDHDILSISKAILTASVTGELSPSEAEALAKIVELHRKTIETADLQQRIAVLEKDVEIQASSRRP
ncbi:MAG: DUF5681 domain-containing protein [Pseudomonadota bacterium]